MSDGQRLVLYGNGKMAELVLHLLDGDPRYRVCAVAADAAFIRSPDFRGLPLVPLADVPARFPAADHAMLVAVGYRRMRSRRDMFERARALGYRLVNYVARGARVSPGLRMGENTIIFDSAHLDPMVRLGSNVIVRPMAYVGHDVVIEDHCFIAPGATIGGGCRVGRLSFIGLGATVTTAATVAEECLVGAATLVLKATDPCGLYVGQPARRVRDLAESGVVIED